MKENVQQILRDAKGVDMAFDGITVANIAHELNQVLAGGGISRIVQSEKDELLLTIKSHRKSYLLLISASASLPLIYLTNTRKEAPLTAPNFCMLLRKHLQGGQVVSVRQPSLERILVFEILHHDELGDLKTKKLIVELMGKYSNIIFTDDQDVIIDSIKRVPASMSSVREVLPGKKWFIPVTQKKHDPLALTEEAFFEAMEESSMDLRRALYQTFTGFSAAASEEFLFEADIDARKGWKDLRQDEKERLCAVVLSHIQDILDGKFTPNMVEKDGEPVEFGSIPILMYRDADHTDISYDSVSELLEAYYGIKEKVTRIRQKSADLRHLVNNALDRTNKKYQLQLKQMKSTEKRDKYRIWGEMLNTYGYEAKEGDKSITCINYYDNKEITVPLDPTLSASQNAQKYFARYNKLKRTAEALKDQIVETENDREQLESVLTSIDLAENESDLSEIRRELQDFGFIQKKHASRKGARRMAKSAPYIYRSSDGFQILVGKNNYQNEELSFQIAGPNDWWFHAKGMPGSHVIVKTGGKEIPDRTFEEAGSLAAWYSSGRKAPKVEVDYTLRKHLRKKNGGKPGFVIYHTNYSLVAIPDISGLQRIDG